MSNLILTSSQAHRFWSLIEGRSPHVEDDVVEVASKSSGDLYLRLAAVAAGPTPMDIKMGIDRHRSQILEDIPPAPPRKGGAGSFRNPR